MPDFPLAADMALDGDVIGRVGEDELGLPAGEQRLVGHRVERIAAEQAMWSKQPKIPHPADGRPTRLYGWNLVCPGVDGAIQPVDQAIDLHRLEAGDGDIEFDLDLAQELQLMAQDLHVPASVLRQLVIGQGVGSLLSIRQGRST